jgi:hypothetical protein
MLKSNWPVMVSKLSWSSADSVVEIASYSNLTSAPSAAPVKAFVRVYVRGFSSKARRA